MSVASRRPLAPMIFPRQYRRSVTAEKVCIPNVSTQHFEAVMSRLRLNFVHSVPT
jgi:hypothetical protein